MTVQEELAEAKSLMRRSLRDIFSEYEGPALLEKAQLLTAASMHDSLSDEGDEDIFDMKKKAWDMFVEYKKRKGEVDYGA